MNLYEWLKRQDKQIADRCAGTELYFRLSPTRWSLFQTLHPLMKRHLHGVCLDAGAGRVAYAIKIADVVTHYIAMDIQPRPGLDCVGSVLALPVMPGALDSIFCSQVLEHVPDPQRAIDEFYSGLKPGGSMVLSVPHLAYLHNEPHDYLRFTRHGLRYLLERSEFEVIEILPAGGLLSFIGHIPSLVVKSILMPVPVVNWIAIWLNAVYSSLVVWLDNHVDRRKLFALNYIVIARKPKIL